MWFMKTVFLFCEYYLAFLGIVTLSLERGSASKISSNIPTTSRLHQGQEVTSDPSVSWLEKYGVEYEPGITEYSGFGKPSKPNKKNLRHRGKGWKKKGSESFYSSEEKRYLSSSSESKKWSATVASGRPAVFRNSSVSANFTRHEGLLYKNQSFSSNSAEGPTGSTIQRVTSFGHDSGPNFSVEEESGDSRFRNVKIIKEPEVRGSHPLTLVEYQNRGYAQRTHPCDQSSCYPATGNLLIGREERLESTSTCGSREPERFCIVSHLEDQKKCFWCDSRNQYRHPISNIVSKYDDGKRRATWWQAENGVENVSIKLDLEAEFHFTHLIITFKTFRPAAMLIERSFDFGRTWRVYRYFAANCEESFPGISPGPPRKLTDVICENRYSDVAPSRGGEVIFRVLSPNLQIDDPYSEEIQNLLKMTNLRVNFTKLHTLGDDFLDNRQEIKEKYYYSIYSMVVRGSCSCYGHASRCLPLNDEIEPRTDMVHGRCECTHNTKGFNCEKCEEFYNDLPWKPALGKQTNACKRCNCNNHATTCHFDPAVYEATGRISGGVCDDCQHSTMGRNCEQCIPFYFQAPGLDVTDPYVCQPCDCDPRGSLDDGICDPMTDPLNNMESGKCHCKMHVEGRRCDTCKSGFWSFNGTNPHGCEACTCSKLGTVDQQGCNPYTGECICKRHVTGRNCDQCLQEYWGLSPEKDGCKACECDLGGSVDGLCDVITGQCRCLPHVTGRRCNIPKQGYYAGNPDFLVYEAELARTSSLCSQEDCQVVIREPYQDGRDTTWTGLGFQRVHPGSHLDFEVDDIHRTLDYDVIVRYEPQRGGSWNDVEVTVEKLDGDVPDPRGPCANTLNLERKRVNLANDDRYAKVYPSACLEKGKKYKIRLDFRGYPGRDDTPKASILIDSIALIPKTESIPILSYPQKQEYEHYKCGDIFLRVTKTENIHDVCKKYLYSIGFHILEGARECACDPTGSVSSLCDELGGQCNCKPNVVGRKCDRCAPGTYGFGPQGCSPCDCNSVGSLDNFCDFRTGQCKCRVNKNTYGRQCDSCQPGFWNFPDCERCDCNGHADSCESKTGRCINCRDYTDGSYCDRCIEGFYGDPRIGRDIACRPCPCPGAVESGHSFASRCSLDPQTQDVICDCQEEYAGARCDMCANNYYGHPETPGGSCQPCECNNNVDIAHPGNCDPQSGECLACIFNTEGHHCERCKNGYFGDASNELCRECTCNILGTDPEAGFCNKTTGQCQCLPNVIGLNCDRCREDYWKIASGEGCEACDCDPSGSYSTQCNEFDGQCSCKAGFGGRKCDQCLSNHWGNPNKECFACDCNPDGSSTKQCNRTTGACICLPGIGGPKCDMCARGYIGYSPDCQECEECFWNWDKTLEELRAETETLIKEASNIKETGATGSYTSEFSQMEDKLDEVRMILKNSTVSNLDLSKVEDLVVEVKKHIEDSKTKADGVDSELKNHTHRVYLMNGNVEELKNSANDLQREAQKLKNETMKLQEANIEGALNITRDAQKRSRGSQTRVDDTQKILTQSERQRKRVNSLLERASTEFQGSLEKNDIDLKNIADRLDRINDGIPELNDLVCDKRGDPCDSTCGGAGCGTCGGPTCDGAKSKAESANELAKAAKEHMASKDKSVSEKLQAMSNAFREADVARNAANEALQETEMASNKSRKAKMELEKLLGKIEDFLGEQLASPGDIKTTAEKVQKLSISLEPEQISELDQKIQTTIGSLTNIDVILLETAVDLQGANELRDRANSAKTRATNVLETAEQVVKALEEAEAAQKAAQLAIDQANEDVKTAENDIAQITSETADAQQKANSSLSELSALRDRLLMLKKTHVKNDRDLQDAQKMANSAIELAGSLKVNSDHLEKSYMTAIESLESASTEAGGARDRARELQGRANQLATRASSKLKTLNEMQEEYNRHEELLSDLSRQLDTLNERITIYMNFIEDRAEHYRNCQT